MKKLWNKDCVLHLRGTAVSAIGFTLIVAFLNCAGNSVFKDTQKAPNRQNEAITVCESNHSAISEYRIHSNIMKKRKCLQRKPF